MSLKNTNAEPEGKNPSEKGEFTGTEATRKRSVPTCQVFYSDRHRVRDVPLERGVRERPLEKARIYFRGVPFTDLLRLHNSVCP